MRPAGELRQVLYGAACALARERQSMTWRDLAERACIGSRAARDTARNMERAGLLVRVGVQPVAHACRPMVLYAPAVAQQRSTGLPLAAVMRSWATR